MHGAPSGDLYVQINVRDHHLFQREGSDLHCDVPVSFVTSALGGELDVPTLDGRVRLKIPAETQSGKVFRLRGKGVKSVRGGGVGDLLCRVLVETPVNLTSMQKDLLRQFDQSMQNGKNNPQAKGWMDKVRTFFDEMKF